MNRSAFNWLTLFSMLVFLFSGFQTWGQQTSVLKIKMDVLKLKEAEDLFEKGFYEEALKQTELVMTSKELNRAEKEQVILITAKINLELDRIEDVNKNLIALLKSNPNYIINPAVVQQDLLNMYNHYFVVPRLSFSLMGNGNIPLFKGRKDYSISRDLDYGASYKQFVTFGGGIELTYAVRYNFFGSIGFQSNEFGFTRKLPGADSVSIGYKETLSYYEIPVTIGKRFTLSRKNQILATVGLQGSRLFMSASTADISANFPVYSQDHKRTILNYDEISEKNINRKSERQDLYSYGLTLEFNKRFRNILVGVGGSYRMTNQYLNKADERYSNQRLMYTYNYIDNDFQMDLRQIFVKVNYTFSYAIKRKQIKMEAVKLELDPTLPVEENKPLEKPAEK